MIRVRPKIRGLDNHGSGEFGAPRGDHTHRGVDFALLPDSKIEAVSDGIVTKVGYPYADDLHFRYVQITDDLGLNARYFYVDPSVNVGDHIEQGDVIGTAQSLNSRYPGITPHIHFEVKDDRFVYLDPNVYLKRQDD